MSRRQALPLLVAFCAWAVQPEARLWPLLVAYVAAVLLGSWLTHVRSERVPRLGRLGVVLAAVVTLAAPLHLALERGPETLSLEQLRGLPEVTADRLRLERTPSVAPGRLFTDRPQELYVAAPGATAVTLALGDGGPTLSADALGEGLFRVAYDPRRDGPLPVEVGPLTVSIDADGATAPRTLDVVPPVATPRAVCHGPGAPVAGVVLEERDELVLVSRDGVVARVPTLDGPSDCAHLGDRVAVVHRYDPRVTLHDPRTGERLATFEVGLFAHRAAASPDGARLAVATHGVRPTVHLVDPSTGEVLARLLDHAADWLAFGADGDTLVTARRREAELSLLVRRRGGLPVARTLPLGRPAAALGRSPDGGSVWVAVTATRDDLRGRVGNHFVRDTLVQVSVPGLSVLAAEATARATGRQDAPGNVDSGISPLGIAPRRNGELLLTFAGSDELWRLEPGHGAPEVAVRLPELPVPHGVADLGDRFLVASAAGGALGLLDARGEVVLRVALDPEDATPAARADAATRRAGMRTFYAGTRAGVSCQSCHMHGDTDHARHNIGQPVLLTPLTTLGIAGTAPYLRDASNPRVRDLLELSEGHLRGFLEPAEGRGEALEAFVASLARPLAPRALEERDEDRLRRGVTAFARARCTVCHAFPAFTDLGQHPARVLFPEYDRIAAHTLLDTPSLLGVREAGPYLHDGRAETLVDVLGRHNEANRHGDTAALDSSEVGAIAYLLETL